MAKYLQIHVDNPCQQKWEDMQGSASGSFCNSCKKNVVDFTGMSDNQLIEFFKKKPVDVCGRFYSDQLDTTLKIPAKSIPWLKYFFQISLPALLFSYKASAQRLLKKYREPLVLTEKKRVHSLTLVPGIHISGRVTGLKGEPVAFASIMIEGTNEGVAADSNGVFTLKSSNAIMILEVSAAVYEKKHVPITSLHTDIVLNVALIENINLEAIRINSKGVSYTMGGARSSFYTYIINNRNEDTSAANPKNSIAVFPNPAKRSGQINIRWKEPVHNDQLVILYNASGIKLLQETIYVKQSLQETPLNLDVNAAGYYVLQTIDMKTGAKQVTELVIEL
jgi:hypothetical protein